jgi:hypothetical protein
MQIISFIAIAVFGGIPALALLFGLLVLAREQAEHTRAYRDWERDR